MHSFIFVSGPKARVVAVVLYLKTHIGYKWSHYTFIGNFLGILFPFWGFNPRDGNAWVACSTEPPFSKPGSHVNQLSVAINPFPPQKLDLFIRLSITFYPLESLLCVVQKEAVWLVQGDPLHRSEHSWGEASQGSLGERPPRLDIKSEALIPLRGGKELCLLVGRLVSGTATGRRRGRRDRFFWMWSCWLNFKVIAVLYGTKTHTHRHRMPSGCISSLTRQRMLANRKNDVM